MHKVYTTLACIFAAVYRTCMLGHKPCVGMMDDLDIVEGNLSRDLWKASCWEMAKDVSV